MKIPLTARNCHKINSYTTKGHPTFTIMYDYGLTGLLSGMCTVYIVKGHWFYLDGSRVRHLTLLSYLKDFSFRLQLEATIN